MLLSGEIRGAMAYEEAPDDRPKSQPLIDLITRGLKAEAKAGEIRAAGIAYDVRTKDPDGRPIGDAIAVALDHASGFSVLVLQPYSKSRLRGVQFGTLESHPSQWRVFG